MYNLKYIIKQLYEMLLHLQDILGSKYLKTQILRTLLEVNRRIISRIKIIFISKAIINNYAKGE